MRVYLWVHQRKATYLVQGTCYAFETSRRVTAEESTSYGVFVTVLF